MMESALGFIWQEAADDVGRGGTRCGLCSQKLNLAAVSVDPGEDKVGRPVGARAEWRGRVDTGAFQSQNQ